MSQSAIKAIVIDVSKTLLFVTDPSYTGSLNDLHAELVAKDPDYDFWSHFHLNEPLLTALRSISKRIPIYVFSSRQIQNHPPLRSKLDEDFTDVFGAEELRLRKDDPAAYRTITAKIGVAPDEVVYIDDQLPNVKAARSAGMTSLQYGIDNVEATLQSFL